MLHLTRCWSAVKPPTQGAVSGLHMVHAFHAAGFPPGLIQCVTGKSWEIGDYMTTHSKADCISFTGGDTGIKISQKAGMVPLQMELGGKDVCIVCADADLDLAAKSIISGGLSYQVCRRRFACPLHAVYTRHPACMSSCGRDTQMKRTWCCMQAACLANEGS